MSNWELWSKRIFKGFLWYFLLRILCLATAIEVTWQVIVVTVTCSIWSGFLDDIMPTDMEKIK